MLPRISLLPALLIFLAACASLPPVNPPHARELGQQAEALMIQDDYAGAARLFGEATRFDPQNATYWLQWGEMLEADGNHDGAASVFIDALDRLNPPATLYNTVRYRLGLLLAGPLNRPDQVKPLRDRLPTGPERDDLDAMLSLAANRPADALKQLANTLPQARDLDQQARIYYHAALAHARLGDYGESRKMLLYAVNGASSPGLKADIAALYTELLTRSPDQNHQQNGN